MPTFSDLQRNLLEARGRRTVLMHLADLIESEFLPPNPQVQSKRLLLMDDKVPVPQDIFDSVVEDLLKEAAELEEQATIIMNTELQSSTTPPNLEVVEEVVVEPNLEVESPNLEVENDNGNENEEEKPQ